MSERTPAEDDVPDLPPSLDGLPDDQPEESPPATEDPANPDAHGPMFRA